MNMNEHVAVPMNQLDLVLCARPVTGSTTKQRLKIPRCASTQFQKSFADRTITEWNSLPDSITSLASVSSFRSHLSATSCPRRRAHSTPKYLSGDWRLLSRSRSRTCAPITFWLVDQSSPIFSREGRVFKCFSDFRSKSKVVQKSR